MHGAVKWLRTRTGRSLSTVGFLGLAGLVWAWSAGGSGMPAAVAATAQTTGTDAPWIAAAAPAAGGTTYFRLPQRVTAPSTAEVRIAASHPFTLLANEVEVRKGEAAKPYRVILNDKLDYGPNTIGVLVQSGKEVARIVVDGEVRTQTGNAEPIDSGPRWQVSTVPQPGTAWTARQPQMVAGWGAAAASPVEPGSALAAVTFPGAMTGQFQPAAGFEIEVAADPELTGSLTVMTFGARGRLLVGRERDRVFSLVDDDGDGSYDRAEPLCDEITNAQGLCQVGHDIYVVGIKDDRTGLFKVTDADGDDKADSIETLVLHNGGIGEHGPHAVVLGPDGWLYHNLGNHSAIPNKPEPESPSKNHYEGNLLQPKQEDGRGHAAGKKAPGGTIWRFTPDGRKWWLEVNGFRNEYDIAFNNGGDLFTFDSDMEWDEGLPWYRPVRVNHCPPGAEFGWRSGAGKWPEYFYDSLPGVLDVGRGSPTGVVFYEHTQLPERLRGSFLCCDWSMGRLFAVKLTEDGASFAGEAETILNGNPLNAADIEVDRDGSILLANGGRNTKGGVYRLRYIGAGAGPSMPVYAKNVRDLLTMPQVHANWFREDARKVALDMGDGPWIQALTQAAQAGTPAEKVRALTIMNTIGPKPSLALLAAASEDADAAVRRFATWCLAGFGTQAEDAIVARLEDDDAHVRRRAMEAVVRAGIRPRFRRYGADLVSQDRFLRFAAGRLLAFEAERSGAGDGLDGDPPPFALDDPAHVARFEAAMAWVAKQQARDGAAAAAGADRTRDFVAGKLVGQAGTPVELDLLRALQLALTDAEATPEMRGRLAAAVRVGLFAESGLAPPDRERVRLLCFLGDGASAAAMVQRMQTLSSVSHADAIHVFYCLSFLQAGWTDGLKADFTRWYEGTAPWEGGNSFEPYLANIYWAWAERNLSPEDVAGFLRDWRRNPIVAKVLLERSKPEGIAGGGDVLATLHEQFMAADASAAVNALRETSLEKLGDSAGPKTQDYLRHLFETQPDIRDAIVRQLAKRPSAANWPMYVRALRGDDRTTLAKVMAALTKVRTVPEAKDRASMLRDVLLAGLKLHQRARWPAVNLFAKWSGQPVPEGRDAEEQFERTLAWYHQTYPDEPKAALPEAKGAYTVAQLTQFLDAGKGRSGDVAAGEKVYTAANCVKCHQFGKVGVGVGPDLTAIRRRFQRKEIVENVLHPSQVISDQYQSDIVATEDGEVVIGMVAAETTPETLVLVNGEGDKVRIPTDQIAQRQKAKVSVMPDGLFDKLTLRQIADLFAYLETSTAAPLPTPSSE